MSQDAIIRAMSNRAVSRCYSKWMMPAQVGGAACILLWPLGAVAGTLGIAALLTMGVGSALAGLNMADRESRKIGQGDADAIAKYLTDDDVAEFTTKMSAVKKMLGTVEEESQEPQTPSGNNAQTEPGNRSTDTPSTPLASRPPAWPDGEHLFMVGLSGAAKTTVLQSITERVSGPVVYLTIKTDDKAPEGWLAYRLDKFAGEKLLNQSLWVLDTLEGWVRAGKQHRLIIDEYVSLQDAVRSACKMLPPGHEMKSLSDRLENLVKLYIRTGRSDGHCLGLLSQTPNGTDNFGSAKTQQGLRILLCASERSSEKFRFLVPWARQLFADLITPAIAEQLGGIKSGYWHLFADRGELVLNRTEKPMAAQVPCQECPTHFSGGKPAQEGQEPKPLGVRIVEYLSRSGEAKTAREIRSACTRPTDNPRASVGDVRDLLCLMISEGQIERVIDGNVERYRATVTA